MCLHLFAKPVEIQPVLLTSAEIVVCSALAGREHRHNCEPNGELTLILVAKVSPEASENADAVAQRDTNRSSVR